MSLEDIIAETADEPEYEAIFNNAAQAWNHSFLWNSTFCVMTYTLRDLSLVTDGLGGWGLVMFICVSSCLDKIFKGVAEWVPERVQP